MENQEPWELDLIKSVMVYTDGRYSLKGRHLPSTLHPVLSTLDFTEPHHDLVPLLSPCHLGRIQSSESGVFCLGHTTSEQPTQETESEATVPTTEGSGHTVGIACQKTISSGSMSLNS